jgi:UDP-GlcNAc3NAcA epimerase
MPEEINRVLCDHLSDLLFAPTNAAVDHLAAEGISGEKVACVGDVMYDVALWAGERADRESTVLARLGLRPGSYALATVHRAENTEDPDRLRAVFGGLAILSRRMPVVVPLHPRTRAPLAATGIELPSDLRLIEPVGYLDMVKLEKSAALVATDSGGVQKEAFFHRVPCATLRDETEWVELVELGWNRLTAPTDAEEVGQGLLSALGTKGREASPYGDGRAARGIAGRLRMAGFEKQG